MRQNECSLSVIQDRYGIGSGTVQLILKRFSASGFTLEQLKTMEPRDVERVPCEKMYIDWVGDQPELLVVPDTGELKKIHL